MRMLRQLVRNVSKGIKEYRHPSAPLKRRGSTKISPKISADTKFADDLEDVINRFQLVTISCRRNADVKSDDTDNNSVIIDYGPELPLLPPQCPQFKGRKTLVLDLDETLIHSYFKEVTGYHFKLKLGGGTGTEAESIYVFKRHKVQRFLKAMAKIFEVVIFTASAQQYADAVIDVLDIYRTVAHRLYRDSCTEYLGGYVKDLSLLGREMRNVVLVDNNPHSFLFQPDNAIQIASFYDDPSDRHLVDLIPVLSTLARFYDVTQVLRQLRSNSI